MKGLRIIKKIGIWLVASLLLVALSLYVLLRFYEDDVVAFAFEKSKDVFTRPITIEDIDLAFWHTFPNASLHLQKVHIPDLFDAKDTLFNAQDVYLEFDLFDLFRAHYELLEVEVEDATAKVMYNKSGEDNYHFWKTSNDSTGFNVALQEVLLQNVHFFYRDQQARKVVDVYTKRSVAAGDLSQREAELDIQTESVLKMLWSNDQVLWKNQELTVDAKVLANYADKNYAFHNASVQMGSMGLLLNGLINTAKDPYFDLNCKGDDIDLEQLLSLLPDSQQQQMKGYEPQGDVNLAASYKGVLNNKKSPQLILDVSIANGQLQSPDGAVELNQIELASHIASAGDGWQIAIDKGFAALAGGQVHVVGKMEAGKTTDVDLKLQAFASADDLKHFFKLDTLEICGGNVQLELQSKGEIRMLPGDSLIDFSALNNTGNAAWNQGELKLKNSNRHFTEIQAAFQLDNKNALVKGFNGVVNGSDFSITGAFQNLIPFLLDERQRLLIEANLNSRLMDFNQLLEVENGGQEDYQLNMPQRIDFSLNTRVEKFIFRNFYADQLRCVAHMQEGKFFIDPLQFNTAGGQLMAQLSLNQTDPQHYFVNCLAQVQNMDITELFREFENFDQSFIQERHLKGKATAMVQFQAPLSHALEVEYKKLYSVIDLKIDQGQLIGLESLQEIAAYIRSNKWMAPFVDEDKFAEKLQDIRFSTLENTIEIKDELIVIPAMDIRSSAMDISIRGQHRFTNEIDYTVGFNLRDVLVRKQKDWQEQDDGLGKQIFVYMRGTTENPTFGMDKEAAKEDRKAEMTAEKQNMKALLKEEFGLFKRDNQVGSFKETTSSKETTTTIQWDDFDAPKENEPQQPKSPEKTPTPAPPPTKEKPKKTPKWLQEKE